MSPSNNDTFKRAHDNIILLIFEPDTILRVDYIQDTNQGAMAKLKLKRFDLFVDGLFTYHIYLNGKRSGSVKNNGSFETELLPGEYTINARIGFILGSYDLNLQVKEECDEPILFYVVPSLSLLTEREFFRFLIFPEKYLQFISPDDRNKINRLRRTRKNEQKDYPALQMPLSFKGQPPLEN